MFSKCANPDCSVEFDPYRGGQFFCFHQPACDSHQTNVHGVKHYWLCEVCSIRYCLVQEPSAEVSLRAILAEGPGFARGPKRKSSAA
jgi:hypothetical protein